MADPAMFNRDEVAALKAGEAVEVGGRRYRACPDCEAVVQVDKPVIGSMHVCDPEAYSEGTAVERDWVTDAGLRAVCLMCRGSHRCGYVEVPKGHPLHGKEHHQETSVLDFDPEDIPLGKKGLVLAFTAAVGGTDGEIRRSPDIAFDVHGGLTYSGSGDNGYPVESDGWWFGFDCSHLGDGSLDPDRYSEGPVRSEQYVVSECERLAEQITEMFPAGHEATA